MKNKGSDGVGVPRVGLEAQPTFRPLDPNIQLEIYNRHLPHWRQEGATYFVTFRQADSIPMEVIEDWREKVARWYCSRNIDLKWRREDPERYALAYKEIPESERRDFEMEQAKWLHVELDKGQGSCVLKEDWTQQIVADSLHHFDGQRMWLGDYVVMPNHVHLILQLFPGFVMEKVLGSIKQWAARKIGKGLGKIGRTRNRPRFWQQESYDRIIRDEKEWKSFRKYIEGNPVKAGCKDGEFRLGLTEVGWASSPTFVRVQSFCED